MVKELVIHIGDRKTGSTAIQQALMTKAYACAATRLAYPLQKGWLNHKLLAHALLKKAGAERRTPLYTRLAKRMAAAEADLGVISAENFESVPPTLLAETLAEFMPDHAKTARVVAYVRPHADRVLSSYTQMVKLGDFTGTLDDFAAHTEAKGWYAYAPRFAAWREVFGDRFTLRPMIRDRLAGGDVVRDFLTLALGTEDFTLETPKGANETLTLADIAMLRAFHSRPRQGPAKAAARGAAGWHFARVLAAQAPADPTRLTLHQGVMAEINRAYRSDAAALDAMFFDGTPMAGALDRAAEKAIPVAQSLELADYVDAEALRLIPIFATLTEDLLGRQPKEWPAYLRTFWVDALAEDRA